MKFYKTGEQVNYGLYISPRAMDMCFIGAEGEALNGVPGAMYARLPVLLMLVLSPAFGGVFVMSFPVIVVAMVAYVMFQGIALMIKNMFRRHANLVVMRWEPTMAYFNKKNKTVVDSQKKDSEKK